MNKDRKILKRQEKYRKINKDRKMEKRQKNKKKRQEN